MAQPFTQLLKHKNQEVIFDFLFPLPRVKPTRSTISSSSRIHSTPMASSVSPSPPSCPKLPAPPLAQRMQYSHLESLLLLLSPTLYRPGGVIHVKYRINMFSSCTKLSKSSHFKKKKIHFPSMAFNILSPKSFLSSCHEASSYTGPQAVPSFGHACILLWLFVLELPGKTFPCTSGDSWVRLPSAFTLPQPYSLY